MDCGGGMTWSYDLIIKLPKNQGEGHQGPKGDESQLGRPHTAATSPSPGQQWRKTNIVFTCACCFLQHPSTCRSLWNHCGYSLPIEILLTTTPHHYHHWGGWEVVISFKLKVVYTCNTVQSHFWVFLKLYTHTPYIPVQTAPLPNPSNRKQKTLGRDRGKESWSWSHRRSGMSNQPWQWDDWEICVIFATSIKN